MLITIFSPKLYQLPVLYWKWQVARIEKSADFDLAHKQVLREDSVPWEKCWWTKYSIVRLSFYKVIRLYNHAP
jgi:hypothetical protein